jgi:Hydrolase of X-linked nucleoside diphosphate N terminal
MRRAIRSRAQDGVAFAANDYDMDRYHPVGLPPLSSRLSWTKRQRLRAFFNSLFGTDVEQTQTFDPLEVLAVARGERQVKVQADTRL